MINLILRKLSVLFVLTLLVLFTPAISGSNDAKAACSGDNDTDCRASGDSDENCRFILDTDPNSDGDQSSCTDAVTDAGVRGTTRASADQVNQNAFVDTLCNVFNIATGDGGKAFAAFAIISLGIGFFTGKVSWGLMIGVAAGIAAMFGAPTIVAAISGEDDFGCEEAV